MDMVGIIKQKLHDQFSVQEIDIVDDSDQHIGHAGARPGGQTHFTVKISSSDFSGKTRIQRHKMIYKALDEQMKGAVHALQIIATSPDD